MTYVPVTNLSSSFIFTKKITFKQLMRICNQYNEKCLKSELNYLPLFEIFFFFKLVGETVAFVIKTVLVRHSSDTP